MSMSSRMRRMAPCVALLLLLPMHHVALAKDPDKLTAMDYIEIQQLVNKLSFALDYCTHGGRDFADLFVKDGQFIIDEGNGKPLVFGNREQLIAVAGGPDCKASQVPPRSYILHLSEGLVIAASPGGALGKSYAIYPANKGKYLKEDVAGQMGIYRDEYVKTPDGWRFKSRRHETTPVVGVE